MKKVLDDGFVRLVDKMGDEAAIVQGARVSYGEGTKTVREDVGLIRYLMRHRHTSPFELCVAKFHIRLPIFVERQMVRHRTASLNELSARYSVLPSEYYVPEPDRLRLQKKTNKQGSGQELVDNPAQILNSMTEEGNLLFENYEAYINAGLAREVARINLPLSTYTEKYWQMNLHNLLHFLRLRMDEHAQWEIRQYANAIAEIVKDWVPNVWEAFEDYQLNAITFSAQEQKILSSMLEGVETDVVISKRERDEFAAKLRRLHGN